MVDNICFNYLQNLKSVLIENINHLCELREEKWDLILKSRIWEMELVLESQS